MSHPLPPPICPRCLLVSAEPHPDTNICLIAYQLRNQALRDEIAKVSAHTERATKGMGEMVRLLWKLTIERGTITFTKAEMENIPTGANVTVSRKLDGALAVTAIVKEKEKPQ